MQPETLRYSVDYTDDSAEVPVGGRVRDRVAVLAGAEGETQTEFVRSTCTVRGSVVVTATAAMNLLEEGAVDRAEPEGVGQRVYFEMIGAGDSRPDARGDALGLLRDCGLGEAADYIGLDQLRPC